MKNVLCVKNLVKFQLAILVILLISSCTKPLTLDVAKDLIIQKYQYPQVDIRNYELSTTKEYDLISTKEKISTSDYTPPKLKFLSELENAGFITYSFDLLSANVYGSRWDGVGDEAGPGFTREIKYFTGKKTGRRHTYLIKAIYKHSGILTEKGKQDFIDENRFKVSNTAFGEITGMVESKELNITEVKYTTIVTPTSFGQAIFNIQGQTIEDSVEFRKYDDGWRIEKTNP